MKNSLPQNKFKPQSKRMGFFKENKNPICREKDKIYNTLSES